MTKLVALAHLCALAAQPVLFGRYFGGDHGALTFHAAVGVAIAWLALGQAILCIVCWRRGLLGSVAGLIFTSIFVLDGLQLHLGFVRVVGVHIPLGAGLLAVSFAATLWLWFYAVCPANAVRS